MPYPACGSSTGSNSVGPRKRSAAGRYTSDTVPAVVPDGGINSLSGLRVPHRLNSVGPRKRSAAGRYTSDAVPAVVPDGGINALSGLRVLCWFKQRRPAQVQRRRAIHIRHRTRGCAGWRHKCLIRPTSPFAGSNSVGPRKRSAAGQRVIERSSMKSPDAEKQKPAFWAGSLNSGARTRTNAAGVEQRACRAGPEGVSRCAANNRTEFDEESGCRKAKTRLLGGFFK
ncbi:Uncharacterised protein [Klebsiella pneumoniae]|nr:Uncharacterised protein [Klebsiella pneumoniae]SAX33619.1 Uncharacterised protein [Klebsiella pneumoniae]SBH76262.1 Uncharacterised protein [Klebsiella pneumoniae]SBJ54487.1 Uncharacterised protein [Klebsiella pneumoniae]SLP13300.1 Uncharacterised protein [Klebsiella pneumoniae]